MGRGRIRGIGRKKERGYMNRIGMTKREKKKRENEEEKDD